MFIYLEKERVWWAGGRARTNCSRVRHPVSRLSGSGAGGTARAPVVLVAMAGSRAGSMGGGALSMAPPCSGVRWPCTRTSKSPPACWRCAANIDAANSFSTYRIRDTSSARTWAGAPRGRAAGAAARRRCARRAARACQCAARPCESDASTAACCRKRPAASARRPRAAPRAPACPAASSQCAAGPWGARRPVRAPGSVRSPFSVATYCSSSRTVGRRPCTSRCAVRAAPDQSAHHVNLHSGCGCEQAPAGAPTGRLQLLTCQRPGGCASAQHPVAIAPPRRLFPPGSAATSAWRTEPVG